MARAIDGDELLGIERLLDTDVIRKSKTASWLLDQVLHDIQAMPTLTLPNEPLTLEQLREMNGEPVYCINIDDYSTKEWMIVGKDDCEGRRYIFDFSTYSRNWLAYRRPPEGEEDT